MSYLIVQPPGSSGSDAQTVEQLKSALESKHDGPRTEAINTILRNVLNGEPMPQLLMSMIRFVMPNKNKSMKKLLYYYYEAIPKQNSDNTLKQEFILACNGIRNDLQHANEFICGNTLRFVCKLKETEMLEPLIPIVRQCLDHKHPYVRKNAMLAVQNIYMNHPKMLHDAPQLLYTALKTEQDNASKRNAFIALNAIDSHLTAEWVISNLSNISSMDDPLQVSILNSLKKDVSFFISHSDDFQAIFREMLDSSNPSVAYEAALMIIKSSSNSQNIEAATVSILNLISKISDNSAKLSMLDQVFLLEKTNPGLLREYVVNVLSILGSSDTDVKNRALEITLSVAGSRNVESIVLILKKEIGKTSDADFDGSKEYLKSLINTLIQCALRYPEIVGYQCIHILLESLEHLDSSLSQNIITFIKEIILHLPEKRITILTKLREFLLTSESKPLLQGILWLLGEFQDSEQEFMENWKVFRESIGEIPIVQSEERRISEIDTNEVSLNSKKQQPRILADGTYATESAIYDHKYSNNPSISCLPLRSLILQGEYFICCTLASTLVKSITTFYKRAKSQPKTHINSVKAEAMLIITSIISVGQSHLVKQKIDYDSLSILQSYIKLLCSSDLDTIANVFIDDTRDAFVKMLKISESQREHAEVQKQFENALHVDSDLQIRQLKNSLNNSKFQTQDRSSTETLKEASHLGKLSDIKQLTGFSDPVYAEAYVTTNQCLINLDVLLVNQSSEVLQNLSLEFSTIGDLKVLEKPISQNVAPHEFIHIHYTVRISSTDTGIIFGNITFNYPNLEPDSVILSDIKVDILQYIHPADCSKADFNKMWLEFEWENKINLNTDEEIRLADYLDKIKETTKMRCLTPRDALEGDCDILSAILYAESSFGEAALINVSLEKLESGKITGHARIRSKGQGIAVSLGEILERSI